MVGNLRYKIELAYSWKANKKKYVLLYSFRFDLICI